MSAINRNSTNSTPTPSASSSPNQSQFSEETQKLIEIYREFSKQQIATETRFRDSQQPQTPQPILNIGNLQLKKIGDWEDTSIPLSHPLNPSEKPNHSSPIEDHKDKKD